MLSVFAGLPQTMLQHREYETAILIHQVKCYEVKLSFHFSLININSW